MKIITRFAPSPTGYLHIGGLRTALFNYLFAKKNKGKFLLRIEDTDQKRQVKDADVALMDVLNKIGLKYDNEPIYQSKRIKIYQKFAERLVKDKKAYYCYCSEQRLEKLREAAQAAKKVPKYDGHCRSLSVEEQAANKGKKYVVRFAVPQNSFVRAQDTVYGKISVKTDDLDDFVIIKSDSFPTYHLANVIDDHEMDISHVIRGEEWLPSLPKHILLYQALGYEPPIFVHLPLLLNPDKSKLSKRQGDVAVEDFLKKGYLPESLLNYIALLGWNPGNDQEIFNLDELVNSFSLENINKSGAVFDQVKLDWFNSYYIKMHVESGGAALKSLAQAAKGFVPKHADRAADLLKLFGKRLNNLTELSNVSNFLFKLPSYESASLIFKKSDRARTAQGLELAEKKLDSLPAAKWQESNIHDCLQSLINDKLTAGDIFWPVRVALSGLEKSPSPAEIAQFLGKDESMSRLAKARKKML